MENSPQPGAGDGGEVTRLLRERNQRPGASAELLDLIYAELRALAQHYMNGERRDHTLEATALVHEAYLRLVRDDSVDWAGRREFFLAAADAMRRILVEHARRRGARKRGGAWDRSGLDVVDLASEDHFGELLALDDALEQLAAQDPAAADVVRLRFWAGLSVDETAKTLNLSTRTVDREWSFARAWLLRNLQH